MSWYFPVVDHHNDLYSSANSWDPASLQLDSSADYPPISTPGDPQSTYVRPTPSSPPTSVKIEPDDPDSRFIMELAAFPPHSSSSSRSSPDSYGAYNDSQSSAPPTEVPLRATQASKEMRRMMGVFRLNPFAMHSLSRGGDSEDSTDGSPTSSATWSGEAGPLEEEPVMFEFQLDISGLDTEEDGPVVHTAEPSSRLPAISAHDESQLRAFSPTFELHEGGLPEGHEGAPSTSRYDVDEHQAVSEKDPGIDFRQRQNDSWEEADCAPQSGSDSSSTTVSVQTPLNESSCSPFDNGTLTHVQDHFAQGTGCPEQSQTSPTAEFPSTPLWDIPDNYQTQEGSGAGHNVNYGPPRGGIGHSNTSHPYMRMTYRPPSYTRPYAQPSPPQFQQAQGQPNFYTLSTPANPSPSLLHNARRPSVHESSPSQEIEPVPQSPITLSPHSPATPNSIQYSFNQQHSHYQSQHPSPSHQPQHQHVPVYSPSNSVTPTSMPLRLPISIARSALRSAAAYSNAGSPTSCHNQLPPPSPYNLHSNGQGYRISRRPHPEERIGEHEVYSTPHSPVSEEHREAYVPTTTMTMGMPISAPMHPILQRSSTYTGGHQVPQLLTGGAVASSSAQGHPNTNNRRWSLPEMSVGARPPVGHGELFLGHHM